jgi:flagellar biosynthesis protein FlhA
VLLQRIKAIRKQIAGELGFLVPPIHIKDNLSIGPSEYVIYVKGNEVGRGEVHPNHYLAIDPGNAQKGLEGGRVKEPVFGLPALSILEEDREKAQMLGYTVVDATTVIATHLTEVIKQHAHEVITRQDVHNLCNNLAKEYPKVVEELIPNLLPLSVVHRVLQHLLKERVSVRDLLTIMETLADQAHATKDPEILTEYVRQALSRQITKEYKQRDGTIKVITLTPDLEEKVSKSLIATPQGSYPALEPQEVRSFVDEVKRSMEEVARQGHMPVLLTSPEIRRHVKKILERFVSSIPVLSYNEIAPDIRVIAVNQ